MSFERWKWEESEGGLLLPDRKIIQPKASMIVAPSRFGGAAPINANVSMASTNSAASVTLPSHASGDYIVIFAYRDGNNNTPTVPAGYTALTTTGLIGASTNCGVLGYKVAASGAETSGTWTNATGLVAAIVKVAGAGPLSLGNQSGSIPTMGAATGNLVPYTGFTLANSNGHSVVLGFGGQRDTTGNWNNAPVSGMTLGSSNTGSTNITGGHYTTTGVTSFSTVNVNIGGGTSGYASICLEIQNAA